MTRSTIARAVGCTMLALLIAGPLLAQEPEPEQDAAEARIAAGQALFTGDGGCAMCHGQDAKGVQGMTKDLTNGEWTQAEGGTLEAIVEVIKNGLGADKTGGIPMPAHADKLTDEQITALAAYVLSLSS